MTNTGAHNRCPNKILPFCYIQMFSALFFTSYEYPFSARFINSLAKKQYTYIFDRKQFIYAIHKICFYIYFFILRKHVNHQYSIYHFVFNFFGFLYCMSEFESISVYFYRFRWTSSHVVHALPIHTSIGTSIYCLMYLGELYVNIQNIMIIL